MVGLSLKFEASMTVLLDDVAGILVVMGILHQLISSSSIK
jgi:hypothetical protein